MAEITDRGDRAQRSMGHPWMYYVLGACDEAGELAGKVKKLYRDYDGELTDEYRLLIFKEIGDQLWYMSRLARKLGSSLAEIAHLNNEKLLDRLERGKLHGDGDNR
jgi:NTP pyrophosphatase (non-canonical NTP hydrolase)